MNKIDKKRIPEEFWQEYRKNITARCIGSAVLLAAAGVLCGVLDFSGLKYPAMGAVLVLAVGVVLACLIFKIHRILFKKSWMGTILEAGASNKYKSGNKGSPKLTSTVTVTVDRGDSEPYSEDIVEKDREGKNLYQLEAPYKVGDTVAYFRGMKRFVRLNVENPEGLFDPKFACAYCGHINGADRERCYGCGKFLIK